MMRVRFRYSSWLAWWLNVGAITLYPFVFVVYTKEETPRFLVEHEFIHVRQVRALGWWRFYASYLWQYLCGLLRTGNTDKAYMGVSYEVEAYEQEDKVTLSAEERAELEA